MSAYVAFWQRLGNFLRPNGSTAVHLKPGASAAVVDAPSGVSNAAHIAARKPGGGGGGVLRPRDAGARVHELVDSMQTHFERQDRRAEQLNASIERVASMLETLAEAQRQQTESLRAISTHTHVTSTHSAATAHVLERVPATLEAQADAMRGVARQLEASQTSDGELVTSLRSFGEAADKLHASGVAQVQTLERLSTNDRHQTDALAQLVREQGRRFMAIIGISAFLALGALASMGVTIAVLLSK